MISVPEQNASRNTETSLLDLIPAGLSEQERKRWQTIQAEILLGMADRDGFSQIPHAITRRLMRFLNDGEFKCVMAIYDETIGRGRESGAVSLSTIEELTGMQRSPVCRALGRVIKLGFIARQRQQDNAGDPAASIYAPAIKPIYEKKQPNSHAGVGVSAPPTKKRQGVVTGGSPSKESVLDPKIKDSSSPEQSLPIQEPSPIRTDDEAPSPAITASTSPEQHRPIQQTTVETPAAEETPWFSQDDVRSAVLDLRVARATNPMGYTDPGRLQITKPPDQAITIRCLNLFENMLHFQGWLKGTVKRGLADKAKCPGYGLWEADARKYAENFQFAVAAEELLRAEAALAEEKYRAQEKAEAERQHLEKLQLQRIMETPVAPEAAIQFAGAPIPDLLRQRLTRLAELISPSAVIEQAQTWLSRGPCKACHDAGTTGTPTLRTLSFCDCPVGEEKRHELGADFCQREIDRVHADMKTLLVTAATDRKFYFDYVIVNSAVEDDGQLLTIKLPEKSHLVAPSVDEGVKELLAYLGVSRNVSMQVPGEVAPEPRKTPVAKPPHPATPAVKPKERTVLTSAPCPRCGGSVVLYSDGSGEECPCRRKRFMQDYTGFIAGMQTKLGPNGAAPPPA